MGALDACGQYEPCGHTACVVLAVVELAHTKPAAHWLSEGSVLPGARQ